ncbi:glycosyltransferase [Hydrogenobacter thermophilus]|uniref:glycosyltransferase n=1 Tax=Hydrogenobacter thermophilus TaxID=940 RepID=UPI0030F81E4F
MRNFLAKADLHLHSKASNLPGGWFSRLIGCPESYAEPIELYKRLKERGMTFVTITDHNTIQGVLEIAHLPDVFISCEYTVEFPDEEAKVHVIAYGIEEKHHIDLMKIRQNIYEFVSYLKENSIPHTLAHPLYSVQGTKITRRLIDKMALLFDSWEVINGTRGTNIRSIEENIAKLYSGWDRIRELEERYRIKSFRSRENISFTAGSDDHGGMDVGRTWTQVEGVRDVRDFLKGILEGKTHVGTEKLGEERLINMISRVGYEYVKRHYNIPAEINSILDHIFMYQENPAIDLGLRYLLGFNVERTKLVKEIMENLPFITLKRFQQKRSLRELAELVLSLPFYAFPAFVKYAQKREENKIEALAKEFGISLRRNTKVAYFTDTYWDVNGVARTANIMRSLASEEDLPFHFFTCSKKALEEENFTSLKARVEFAVPFYEEIKMGIPSFTQLVEFLEKGEFTGVHIATPGPLGIMAFLAGKILRLRITIAFHTDLPTYARIYTQDEDLENILWKIFVFLANSSDRCFVPSEHYRKTLIIKGANPSKLSLFRRGIDTELFSPDRREEGFWSARLGKRVSKVILYVGRVAKEKNLDTFLYVAKCLPQETFVVVGDGPYRKELEKKKPKNVHFVGYMKGEELAKAYASSHLFLFPSETETYAQVVLEAMACAIPVVVSSKGASHEHVDDGLNGFIATSKEDYVKKVELLLSDEGLYRMVSAEALRKAKSLDMKKTYLDYMYAIAGLGRLVYESY